MAKSIDNAFFTYITYVIVDLHEFLKIILFGTSFDRVFLAAWICELEK